MASNDLPPEAGKVGTQAETSMEGGNAAANTSALRRSPKSESRKTSDMSATSPMAPALRKHSSNNVVPIASPSPASSPRTSRNASPTRKDSRPPAPLSTPISTQPSAAAIQRALSAANVPSLQGGDAASRLPRPPKSAGASGDNTPHWPTSPRLKSPPPSGSNSRRGSAATAPKKAESVPTPSINVQSATPQTSTPQSSTPPLVKQSTEEATKPVQLQAPVKGPSRGPSGKSTLETVQENSTDDKEPSPAAVQAAADLKPLTKIAEDDDQAKGEASIVEGDKTAHQIESGSESAGTKSEKKKEEKMQAQRSKPSHAKSYTSLTSTKSRQDTKQGMTVETEIVASVPQSALSAGDRSSGARGENSGSIKLKRSSETIRPKKERKKPTQKARSINQGTAKYDDGDAGSSRSSSTVRETPSSNDANSPRLQRHLSSSKKLQCKLSLRRPTSYLRSLSDMYLRKASSKADIFEARVANAVDEANSSDSDETFVYESNPPETQRRRHHSRTPSVTSSHSVADQRSAGLRNFGDVLDERRVAGKRSMKFSNNPYTEIDSPESKDGSVRSHQPRHFGRLGRGGSHASMFDQDSPFTQASKLRNSQLNLRGSRPNSPRSPYEGQHTPRTSSLFGRKQEPSYDFDAEGDDDERAPLMGSVRTARSTRLSRRIHTSPEIDEYYGVRRHSRCGRFGGCLLGLVVLAAVILSALAFLVLSNRPLYEVKIREIQNVLASEQEIMLDLLVGAVNPNALGIAVAEMDINVFAKSKHVESLRLWEDDAPRGTIADTAKRKRGRSRSSQSSNVDPLDNRLTPSGGVDEGTDPEDPEGDSQTMLLGRLFEFDQPLSFEGSPLKRHVHYSVGELRLDEPGNRTETGGSERWEKVLQYPFELIIRGVFKYQLPISSRLQKAAVAASAIVHPDEGVDEFGNMRVEMIDPGEKRQWVDWDAAKVTKTEEE